MAEVDKLNALPADEDVAAAWMQGVASEWRTELADVREDIYTLDDGEPIHAAKDIFCNPKHSNFSTTPKTVCG